MTRTLARKLEYGATLVALGVVTAGPLLWVRAPGWVWLVTGALLLIPGRIAGHYFRDLFTGRRLMDARRFAEAIPHFERFLEHIRAQPGLKKFIWLSAGIYTRDVEAMALNNLGAVRLELGELDRVEAPLRQALVLDPDYPIPYVNLAHLAVLRGDTAMAADASSAAKRLGYNATRIDALLNHVSSSLATLEGRDK